VEKFPKLLGNPPPKFGEGAISSQAEYMRIYVFGRFRDYNGSSLRKGKWDSPFHLETNG